MLLHANAVLTALTNNFMQKILTLLAILVCNAVYAQNTFKAIIKDDDTKKPLTGATAIITSLKKGSTADTSGQIFINNIPDGRVQVKVRVKPEDGKATAAVLTLLAQALGVGVSRLDMLRGATSRDKLIKIPPAD